jgi:hypothetical protein
MRVKLAFHQNISSNRCWFHVETHEKSTIRELKSQLQQEFEIEDDIDLEIEGFLLLDDSKTIGVLRENDALTVLKRENGQKRKVEMIKSTEESNKRKRISPPVPEFPMIPFMPKQHFTPVESDESLDETDTTGTTVSSDESEKSEQEPLEGVFVDAGPSNEPIRPPISLSGPKKKQVAELLKHASKHIRFDEQDSSDSEPESSQSREVRPPRDESQAPEINHSKTSTLILSLASLHDPKMQNGKAHNRTDGLRQHIQHLFQGEGSPLTQSTPESVSVSGKKTRRGTRGKGKQRDFTKMPHVNDIPMIGQRIAYKTLILSEGYQPTLSEFIVADVLNVNGTNLELKNEVPTTEGVDECTGKFAIGDEDLIGVQEFVNVEFADLSDVRLVKQ